ncbi:DHA3 family multidrug efflux protein-like MFS transporter [Promicromonospora sp. AC04]|uniref:MFS transporter n=1 Tax=Promicromonospora sp. AC04 TaxID=2135723 RepID=UPI000D34E4D6|nr:MFS transporter [Promicromonospora sp. AC04]PUB31782.1 DHA3 family multidrug efflux protein-like MFS transporter [Promicromonospora sp. AC04]
MSNEASQAAVDPPRLHLSDPTVRTFVKLLVNVLVVGVINFTVWFAITFFVFLQTRSVFATGVIAGLFLVSMVATGVWFGSLVDHHRKKTVMQASALVSIVFYAACLVIYLLTPAEEWTNPGSVRLWSLIVLLMCGVIAGNLRSIALPTVVTALFDETLRDRANGLVGTVLGISFLVTSVISGLLVAFDGMRTCLILAIGVLAVALVHMHFIKVPESLSHAAAEGEPRKVDLRGTMKVVGSIPGMWALIAFTALNNLLGGAFMALMDAYGLSMMSVQAWGFVWGGLSALMILAGLLIARTGLGSNPVRTILLVNMALWAVTVVFPMRASVVWLVAGLAVYMMAMPYVEASEQTVLQKVVPYERQGRVFGFAQSLEQAASPLTAFLISPLTQFFFIPFMREGGTGARWIGDWFGTGDARGIALVFVLIAVLGLLLTGYALSSKYYRLLSRRYREAPDAATEGTPPSAAAV